ncbi:hypothetical protein SUGI_0067300 [Cryptomeria japonica]|nr:hypothetical protein SUGI_0067300 [Cryptomeria japonica]
MAPTMLWKRQSGVAHFQVVWVSKTSAKLQDKGNHKHLIGSSDQCSKDPHPTPVPFFGWLHASPHTTYPILVAKD